MLPDYFELNDALAGVNAPVNASEAHGIICGLICAGDKAHHVSMLEPILGALDAKDELSLRPRELILEAYQCATQQLKELQFDFQILVPDDDTAINERALSLSEWCHGFLSGLNMTGLSFESNISDDCRDALYHMAEIAELDYESVSIEEEDEKSYVELYEYLRTAAMMIHCEFVMGTPSENLQQRPEMATVH